MAVPTNDRAVPTNDQRRPGKRTRKIRNISSLGSPLATREGGWTRRVEAHVLGTRCRRRDAEDRIILEGGGFMPESYGRTSPLFTAVAEPSRLSTLQSSRLSPISSVAGI